MRSPFTISLFLALPFILTPSLAVPVNSNTTAITLPTHNVKLPPIYNLTGRDEGARSVEGVVRRDDPVNDAGDNMNTGPTGADQGAMSFGELGVSCFSTSTTCSLSSTSSYSTLLFS